MRDLELLNEYLEENNAEELQLLSEYHSKNIFKTTYCPLETKEFYMYPKGCYMNFEGDTISACPNTKCGKARLDDNGNSSATIKQLLLAEQLGHLVTSAGFQECLKYKASRDTIYHQNEASFLTDYFDGSKHQNVNNINLLMYTDGFNPFKRGGVHMTIVMFVVLNLPPELR